MLENGEMAAMIEGAKSAVSPRTDNFNHAIGNSSAYDSALKTMAWRLVCAAIFTRCREGYQAAAIYSCPLP